MKKIIVAGSRSLNNKHYIYSVLYSLIDPETSEIVSGGASGPDSIALEFAKEFRISWKLFLADWQKYGNGAGIRRNKEMGEYADSLVAFWNGKSKGTKHMIDYMAEKKKSVIVVYMYE